MEEELYRKLDEYGTKKMIFKMAWDRTEDGREVKRGAMIKDNNGRLITENKEVLRIWAANFKELLNGKGAASCLELPSSVRREVEVGVGDDWRGGSQVDRKATERVYAGGKDTEEWRMGLIVPIWKRKGDVHDPGKYRGITLLSQVLKLLERVLDARIRRRVEGDLGE